MLRFFYSPSLAVDQKLLMSLPCYSNLPSIPWWTVGMSFALSKEKSDKEWVFE